MQTFYMLICKGKLYLYEKKNSAFEQVCIEGNPEFYYDTRVLKEDFDRLLESLANEYNLEKLYDENEQEETESSLDRGKKYDIEFVVLDNEDKSISDAMGDLYKKYLKKKYDASLLMFDVMKKLDKDKNLMIFEFGVNFDGKNYRLENSVQKKSDFSLLGYTLQEDDLIKFVEAL